MSIVQVAFVNHLINELCMYVCPVCPVCLSVTLVYCGQTVGRMKMKLGKHVGLGPGHIVLDRYPVRPPPKGGEDGAPNFWPVYVAAKWLQGSRCHLVWR